MKTLSGHEIREIYENWYLVAALLGEYRKGMLFTPFHQKSCHNCLLKTIRSVHGTMVVWTL